MITSVSAIGRDILTLMNYRATFATFCGLAILPLSAQTPLACVAQLVPLKPVGLFCKEAAPVCITDSSGANGEWVWGCPAPTSSNPTIPTQVIPPQPVKPPQINSAIDVYLKAEQIRQMRQQTELMRQQTEALRQSNESQVLPMITSSVPYYPLAFAYSTMPTPTGNKGRDQRNWNKWVKQNPSVRTVLPPWSPEAYEQVRALAAAQVTGGR